MEHQKSHYVTDWLEKRAKLTPDTIALEDADHGTRTTYAEWNAAANRTARMLDRMGIGKGDLVSVYSVNRREYLDLLFACGKTGAILHNLNWRLTVHELASILGETQPRLLFFSPEWAKQVEQLSDRFPTLSCIPFEADDDRGHGNFHQRDHEVPHWKQVDLEMDHPWGIYYTGGTTGLPKGAIMTHGNMTWNSINTIMSWQLTADDVAALQLPFFHVGGPNIFFLPLIHVGGKTILAREFNVEQTFDLIESSGVTLYIGVPTMYVMLQSHARWESADFSRLKLVISGGAPCPLPVMQRFWDRGVDFKMGYGLTEAAGNNFWMPPGRAPSKPGSVGVPIFHIDMRVVDEDSKPCPPEREGELHIRGPHITPGYYRQPGETAKVLQDGWLKTGDMATYDKDGYYTILGRSKDMFISGGENVYPAEVESVMHAHEAVAEAALIGVPHEKWGEVGCAFVVLNPGFDLKQEQLAAFMVERLAKFKLPRTFHFIDEMPKTVIGKIDKLALSARYEKGEA